MKHLINVFLFVFIILNSNSLAVFPSDYVIALDELEVKNDKYFLGVLVSGFHEKMYSIVIYKNELRFDKKKELLYEQFLFNEFIEDESLSVDSGKFDIKLKEIIIAFSDNISRSYDISEIF